jgi:hypothetical protein
MRVACPLHDLKEVRRWEKRGKENQEEQKKPLLSACECDNDFD